MALGVVLALDKGGVRFAVRPFGPFQLGGRWLPRGDEDARVVLSREDAALAGRPNVHVAGSEGGVVAYVVR
jgi:hypothetical protein